MKNAEWLAKIRAEKGLDIKDPVVPDVRLFPDLLWVWEGFITLSRCRGNNESGPQPITVSEINAYAEYRNIDGDYERKTFLKYVGELDDKYLAHKYDERAKAEKKAKADAERKRRSGRR